MSKVVHILKYKGRQPFLACGRKYSVDKIEVSFYRLSKICKRCLKVVRNHNGEYL